VVRSRRNFSRRDGSTDFFRYGFGARAPEQPRRDGSISSVQKRSPDLATSSALAEVLFSKRTARSNPPLMEVRLR
jgi:hypothetical protein